MVGLEGKGCEDRGDGSLEPGEDGIWRETGDGRYGVYMVYI